MNKFLLQHKKLTRLNKAFTLIELLVVIATIAILAAILFPVFGRARETARKSSCQSNLKQIGIGILQYTQDYDERYPIISNPNTSVAIFPYGWADGIQPYVKSTQILQCPSDTSPQPTTAEQRNYTDYYMNSMLNERTPTGGKSANGTAVSAALYPALSVMVGEGGPSNIHSAARFNCNGAEAGGSGGNLANVTTTHAPGVSSNLAAGGRDHLEGANLLFIDGHVKWLKADTGQASGKIYNYVTGFSSTTPSSGQNATFNVIKE